LGETDLLAAAAIAGNRGLNSVLGDVDAERVVVLEAALEGVGTRDSAERARLLALLALELVDAGDFHHRKALADEAVAIARRLGDPAVIVNVLISSFFATVAPGTLTQRREAISEVRRLARELGDPVSRFWAESHHVGVSLEAGDRDELDCGFRVMEEVVAEVGQPFLRWVATYQGSWRALLASDTVGAERLALEALQLGNDSGQPEAAGLFGLQLLWVRAYQGRLGELIAFAAQTVADNPGNHGARAGLAYAYCEVDQVEEARALLDAETAAGFVRPVNWGWLPDMTLWAAVASEVGDAEAAAVLGDRLAPWHDQVPYTGASVHGAVAMYCGGLARVLGRDREAEIYFAEALKINEHLQAPFFVAHTNLEWARLLVGRRDEGDLDRARAQLKEALNLAQEYGFGTVERRAAALLTAVS
jgi:tetratricopeptide (TPR) repeat protein